MQLKAEVLKEEVKVEEKQEALDETNKDKFGESGDLKGIQSQGGGIQIKYEFSFLL